MPDTLALNKNVPSPIFLDFIWLTGADWAFVKLWCRTKTFACGIGRTISFCYLASVHLVYMVGFWDEMCSLLAWL